MEKPITEVSSSDCLFSGKPSSTRSGPNGDIHRTPAPTDLLSSLKLKLIGKRISHIEESHASKPVLLHDRKQQLGVHNDRLSPPTTSASADHRWSGGGQPTWLARTQAPFGKSANGVDPAEKVALEQRQILLAVVSFAQIRRRNPAIPPAPAHRRRPSSGSLNRG